MTLHSPEGLKSYVLGRCFGRDDKVFASGVRANNKIDIELLADDPVGHRMVHALGGVIRRYRPDFLVPVPNGARWITAMLSEELSVPEVFLEKHNDRTIHYPNPEEMERVLGFRRGVVIEDLLNRYTNTRKVLALPGMAERIVAAAALMDRGDPAVREPLTIPAYALVSEPIPEQLPVDSVYWSYAKTA